MEPPDARPDPDALLRRVTAEEERARRAKLKLYFGFAPGVGKTYAMLEVAQRLRAEGVDVVVGCVETHGRAETAALAAGLEALPRLTVAYRGTTLTELDLDAALARKPAVLLLDELAHTNAPGLRHKKRWQDLLDLLAAGIEVHTTLNVQHVESLNDVIAQVTGVRVRETVPDHILDRADEIELVDLPPEELLLRLREGKVYVPEQAARATQNFFQRGKLLALRELALRRTAERVEADVRAYREEHSIQATSASAERILVCVSPSPTSARLVRGAYRMASGLRAHWIAAYVDVLGAPLAGRADRERLEGHLHLAESLGAEIVRLAGSKVSAALIDYARQHHVTRLVIGKPTHPRLRDRLRGSLLDEVVRGSGDLDVHVISGDEAATTPPAAPRAPHTPLRGASYATAVALVAGATALGIAVRPAFADADTAMIYLFVIMVVGAWLGRGPALLAAALSVATFDFFFVPPFHTFAVSDARHLLTFAVMFGVGVATSAIAARLRRQERAATSREARTGALYALSRELGAAVDADGVALAAAHHAAAAFGGGAAVLLAVGEGELRTVAPRGHTLLGPDELAVARWALAHGEPAGAGADTLPGARIRCLPLVASGVSLGVLALSAPEHGVLAPADRDFVEAFLRQVCLALERARLAEEAKAAALKARTEEMRSSLLSAVSHDLRTPLAVITGAAAVLGDDTTELPPLDRAELIGTIGDEARRLERLVGNLLDMTRLEAGVVPKREWVPLEELVGSALGRLERELEGRAIATELAPDLPLLPVDPVSFEQVFVNLLDNAAKHTPAGGPVELAASFAEGVVTIEVRDRGAGVPPEALQRLFEKFYRGPGASSAGSGLGLAICRAVVEAHGGSLEAANRPGGGAVFRVRLPIVGEPPGLDPEAPLAPSARHPSEVAP